MKISPLKVLIPLAVILLASTALSACASLGIAQPGAGEPTAIPTITNVGSVTAEGRVVPRDFVYLAFPTNGEISAVLVSEGETVPQGTVLARLGKREQLEAALTAAKLEQISAQQELDTLNQKAGLAKTETGQALADAQKAVIDAQQAFDDLDTDTFRDDLDDKEIAVQDADEKLKDAQEELDKYTNLDPDNSTRKNAQDALDDAQQEFDDAVYERDLLQNEWDEAQAALELAKSQLADLQDEYDARLDGPDPDDLSLAQARVDNAVAQIAAAQRALDNMDLTAPYEGTVVDLNQISPGEWMTTGKTAVTFADLTAWYVETKDLTELEVIDVSVGQPVVLLPDAIADLELNGVVESIDGVYTEKSGDILYTVRIRLDQTDERLRWGMTVTTRFEK